MGMPRGSELAFSHSVASRFWPRRSTSLPRALPS